MAGGVGPASRARGGHHQGSQQRGRRGGRGKGRSKSVQDDPAALARAMAKIHLEEANGLYKCGLYTKGIRSYCLALELQPEDVEALVSRSRCYLAVGQPGSALKDAEAALVVEPGCIRGIYQKAEALYHLGDFEHSLVFYHRGQRIRPEMECFRLGVQKAQEAIQNTIGKKGPRQPRTRKTSSVAGPKSPPSPPGAPVTPAKAQASLFSSKRKALSSLTTPDSGSRSSRQLLGELCVDKLYLENLLQHPDIKAPHQEACSHIAGPAQEAVAYLAGREEFWRQQKVKNGPQGARSAQRGRFQTSNGRAR